MYRFFVFIMLSIFPVKYATAYDFQELDTVFLKLKSDYIDTVDAKYLALKSSHVFKRYDSEVKLYYKDSNALLYYHSDFIKSFSFPKDDNILSWKNYLKDILITTAKCSPKINKNIFKIEEDVVKKIVNHLDKYSRVERNKEINTFFDYTVRNNILCIKLPSFSKGDAESLKKIISLFPDINGLIFDLRGNRGGQFNEALKVADLFLDSALITYSLEKNHPQRFYTATKGDILSGKPLAVLVDENTASAAEMVAAAFNDQNRAVLIGCKTYGKGSIQHSYPIGNQTLYLTSGYFFSPSGKKIDKQGVFPQICTGLDKECCFSDKADPQKDILTAIRYIENKMS